MLKRGVFIALFVILLIGLISAIPFIAFVNPTPASGTQTTGSSLIINATITGVSKLLEFVFNWQGTNYTLYDEDLILHLNLNNNSALGENDTHVYDSSRAGHNGTIVGSILSSNGKYQGGISIDEDDEYINLSDHADFRGENFTISLWYNKSSVGVKQVVADSFSSYILLENGQIYSWGANIDGQLGDGTTINIEKPTPVLKNYVFSSLAISHYPGSNVGQGHMCGLLNNGSALCWGNNGNGELGIGNTTDMYSPTYVTGGHNFSVIHIGRTNSCGLLNNGSMLCWGRNTYGQLGIDVGNTTQMHIPTYVSGNYTFSSMTMGDYMTCGLQLNGSALCWGRNDKGQIGDNTTNTKYVPTPVYGIISFKKVISGNERTWGIRENDSKVMMWGGRGGLGSLETTNTCFEELGTLTCSHALIPIQINGNFSFLDLEPNYGGFCGILTNGSGVCWGRGLYGVNGNGNVEDVFHPKIIYGDYNLTSLSLGYAHVLAIDSNGNLISWGRDDYAQLGKGSLKKLGINFPVLFPYARISSDNYSDVVPSAVLSCGLFYNGSIYCWGRDIQYSSGLSGQAISEPRCVSKGYIFNWFTSSSATICGLLNNGSALCWGKNTYGQLGIGNTTSIYSPTYILGGHNFSSIIMGNIHKCGLLHNGSVLCWGDNRFGQLGIGNTTTMYAPTSVSGGDNFSLISLGGHLSCGLLHNGSALCWGWNNYGQLGNGTFGGVGLIPQFVSGGYNFSKIYTGAAHSCGLLHNGSALCWGRNIQGQLGLGEGNTTDMYTPTYVSGGHNFSYLSPGWSNNCGLLVNGSIACWGDNTYGQLGDFTFTQREYPKIINMGINISILYERFQGMKYVFFASTEEGSILGWGWNDVDQLGVNSFDYKKPHKGIYKGNLIGKTIYSFEIANTFEGNIRVIVENSFQDINFDDGWNNFLISYDGDTAKIYVNGQENISFENYALRYPTWLVEDLTIGKDARGQIDEILMWNRTLTDDEIQKVYESSLQQRNHTSWEFYSQQTLPSIGTYTYKLFAKDSAGWFSVIRNIIKYVEEDDEEDSPSGGGGSYGSAIYIVKEEKLQQGYDKQLRAGNKLRLEFFRQGAKLLEVLEVDKDNNLVKVVINEIEVSVNNGSSEKIDINNDGFYDLEVSVQDISSSGSSKLMFKEIYEEIPSEEESPVEEPQKEDIPSSDESEEVEKSQWWIYGIIGVGVLVVALLWIVSGRKKRKIK